MHKRTKYISGVVILFILFILSLCFLLSRMKYSPRDMPTLAKHYFTCDLGFIPAASAALDLKDTEMSPSLREQLNRSSAIRVLKLPSNTVDGDLAAIAHLNMLEVLDMSGTKINGAGLLHLHHMSRLKSISLSSTPLNDKGINNLPTLPLLKCLSIGNTAVSEVCLQDLAKKRLDSLELLDISNNQRIGDNSIRELASFPNLKKLNLYNTQVSNACIKSLIEVKELSFVGCGFTKISALGITALKKAKPSLNIDAGD